MKDDLVDIAGLARKLRVSIVWLREETNAGRIPHFSAGDKTLYNLSTVKEYLAEQAGQKKPSTHETIIGRIDGR